MRQLFLTSAARFVDASLGGRRTSEAGIVARR